MPHMKLFLVFVCGLGLRAQTPTIDQSLSAKQGDRRRDLAGWALCRLRRAAGQESGSDTDWISTVALDLFQRVIAAAISNRLPIRIAAQMPVQPHKPKRANPADVRRRALRRCRGVCACGTEKVNGLNPRVGNNRLISRPLT
jgi:hypothetical protein